ncbi:MAG: dTDP-4-dehydrorhamnose reductase [Bacteroidota bacterium]
MPTLLVTGANGQLGREFQRINARFDDFKFLFTTREELDIADKEGVKEFFRQHAFDYCINTAAYTAVDLAEKKREEAFNINVRGVEHIARACLAKDIPLIHFSTDYVYHKLHNTPFLESDATNPKGVYAKTKLEGELRAAEIHESTFVFRVSWLYSVFGVNFVKSMLRLGKERETLNVVFDQISSPTYARDLATTVLQIIGVLEKDYDLAKKLAGVYHYSNEGVCSWYDFAKAIMEMKNIDCKVNPIRSADYPTPAQRPSFSLLDKEKIKHEFNIEIPYWRDSLEACLKLL